MAISLSLGGGGEVGRGEVEMQGIKVGVKKKNVTYENKKTNESMKKVNENKLKQLKH